MKKFSKALLLTLLAVTMILNTCGIALATSTNATVSVTDEEVVDQAKGLMKLVFKITTPAGSDKVRSTGVVFSYDNTVIQPTDKKGTAQTITDGSTSKVPLKAYADPDDPANDYGLNYTLQSAKWYVSGNRTGVSVVTSITPDETSSNLYDATTGMVFTEFYYVLKEGKSADSETFKFETDYSDNSILKKAYDTPSEAAAIIVNAGSFRYGTPSTTDTETIDKPIFDYEGSDVLVLGSVEISPLTVPGVTVPVAYTAEGPTNADAAKLELEAVAKSTIWAEGTAPDMTVSDNAKWEIINWSSAEDNKVSLTGTGAKATLTVQPGALGQDITVKVADGDKEDTVVISLVRTETPVKETYLEIKDGETVVADSVTIAKPATEGTKTKTLTAKVYHPYGEMTAETTFAVVGTAPADFGISEAGVISVTNNAEKGDVAIKATSGALTKNITVRVVDLEVDETPIKVAENIKYGMTIADIITFTSVNGTASVDGKTVTGTFSLAGETTDKPAAGEATIVVLFTPEGNTDDLAVYNGVPVSINKTVTIEKADQVIAAEDVVVDYDGTAKSVTATLTKGDGKITYAPAQSYTDAGTYTITATAAETTNYNEATKEITLTINKAPTVITAVDPEPATYDGTAKAIEATVDNEVSRLEYSYLKEGATAATSEAPVDAGTYTVTITAPETTNYAEAEAKVVTFTINKAEVTEYVVSETNLTKAEFDATKTALEVSTAGVTDVDMLAGYTLPGYVYAAFEGGVEYVEGITWTTADEWNAKEGEYTYTAVFPENGNLIFKPLEATVEVDKVVGRITGFPYEIADKTVAKRRVEALNDEEPSFADLDLPYRITVEYPTATDPMSVELDIVWNKTVADLKAAAATVTEQNPNVNVDLEIADATFTPEGHADFSWITIRPSDKTMTLKITNRLPVDVDVTMDSEFTYGDPITAATAEQKALGDGIDETVAGREGEFTYLYEGTTDNGDDYSSADVPTEAGSYTVTATLVSTTHSGSGSATFTITAKPINVTVDNATKVYGDELPTFALVEPIDGLVGDDVLGAVLKTAATKDSDVGEYDIVVESWANKNYAVTPTNGTLTITRKELTEVPVITGTAAVGSTLTATVDIADEELTFQWFVAGEAVAEATEKTYTPAIKDSNKEITVAITGIKNYEGTQTSAPVTVDKYAITGSIAIEFITDNGAEGADGIYNATDVLGVNTTGISNYAELEAAGLVLDYIWKLDGTEVGTGTTYTVPAETLGDLTVEVKAAEEGNFTGSIASATAELGKAPISGTVTITAEGDVLTATVTDSNATPADYDVEWYRGETKLTPAEDGTYTVTVDDLGKAITVKVVAKAESLFTGAFQSTGYDVPAKAPTVTVATSVGATSITVTVNAVENGAPITGYTITLKNGETVVGTATTSSHTFEGLTAGTTYTIEATATNEAGTTTATATASPYVASSSGLRPSYKPDPKPETPDTGDDEGEGTEGEGEGTTTPEADVEVKVEDTSATVDADVIKDNETVAVSTETESGTTVTTTVNVADANVTSLEVSTKDSDKAAAGAAAEGAVGTPVEVKVDAKDAEGNAADVTVNVAIPSEEKAYAYIIDENGVATRTESVYNEETGEVEVANVPDGAVVMLSTTAPATFDDSAEHWAEDTINYAVDAGIMNGVGGSSFDPDGLATRGMVNAMLVRLAKVAGIEIAEATDDHKVDTDAAHWAAATDLIALANGWSTGVRVNEDGTVVMDTDGTVTREQLVTLLWRFVEHPEAEGDLTSFDDHHETSDWAKDAKAWAVGAGIINGKPGNVLDPTGTATRAEIATMFNRLMNYMTK